MTVWSIVASFHRWSAYVKKLPFPCCLIKLLVIVQTREHSSHLLTPITLARQSRGSVKLAFYTRVSFTVGACLISSYAGERSAQAQPQPVGHVNGSPSSAATYS